MTNSVLIIGAGQAGMQCAVSLRQGGFSGKIDIYGDEPHVPYERPPLSKAVLLGTQDAERTHLRPKSFYEEQNIGLHLGTRLSAETLPPHDTLVIATGTSARTLPGFEGAHVLRSLDDTARLQQSIDPTKKVLIIGAGFIGLEVAAALHDKVASIDVYDLGNQVMGRAAAPAVAASSQDALTAKGVSFHMESSITPEEAEAFDLVLVAIGAVANDQVAVEMGLCEPGQLSANKDALVREHIYAIGDVTLAEHDFLPQAMRLESVDQAVYAAKCAAAHILGAERPAAAAPWFWSFQGDWKLQMVGIWSSDLRVVPFGGEVGSQSFSLFGFSGDTLCAVQCVNRAPDFAAARRLVGKDLPDFETQIEADDFKLKQLL